MLQCLNYSKLSMKIEVFEDVSSSEASKKLSSSKSVSVATSRNDPELDRALKSNQATAFSKFEDFAGLVNSNNDRSDTLPGYLLNCFKSELALLRSIEELQSPSRAENEELLKSPIEQLNEKAE